MDQRSEAFMCKKEFSVYFVYTLSLKFLLFLSYDALRICFLTHLVHRRSTSTVQHLQVREHMVGSLKVFLEGSGVLNR